MVKTRQLSKVLLFTYHYFTNHDKSIVFLGCLPCLECVFFIKSSFKVKTLEKKQFSDGKWYNLKIIFLL